MCLNKIVILDEDYDYRMICSNLSLMTRDGSATKIPQYIHGFLIICEDWFGLKSGAKLPFEFKVLDPLDSKGKLIIKHKPTEREMMKKLCEMVPYKGIRTTPSERNFSSALNMAVLLMKDNETMYFEAPIKWFYLDDHDALDHI